MQPRIAHATRWLVNHGARGHTTKTILWGSRSSIVISRRHTGEATTNTTSQTSTLVGANLCLLIPKPMRIQGGTLRDAKLRSARLGGAAGALGRAAPWGLGRRPGPMTCGARLAASPAVLQIFWSLEIPF